VRAPAGVGALPKGDCAARRLRGRGPTRRARAAQVGPTGRLRDTSTEAVVRVLRLFNLCDVGPAADDARRRPPGATPLASPAAAGAKLPAPAAPAAAASAALLVWLPAPVGCGRPRQRRRAASCDTCRRADAQSVSVSGAVWRRACSWAELCAQGAPAGEAHADSRAAGESAASSGAPGGGGPAVPPPPPGGHASPASDAAAGQDRAGAGADAAAAPANGHAQGGGDGGGGDARERERERRRDRDSGDGRGRRRDSGRARDGERDADKRGRGEDARGGDGGAGGGELSARQRARMADLSLLLEVVLRTSAGGARREFCRCGVLHQLQAVLGRCLSGQYAVVLRKLLRCAEALPFGADDLHTAASAHGSFADVLKQLAVQHADVEARPRAPARRARRAQAACVESAPASRAQH